MKEFTEKLSLLYLFVFSFYEISSRYRALSSTQMYMIPKCESSSDLLSDLQTLYLLNISSHISKNIPHVVMSKQKYQAASPTLLL